MRQHGIRLSSVAYGERPRHVRAMEETDSPVSLGLVDDQKQREEQGPFALSEIFVPALI